MKTSANCSLMASMLRKKWKTLHLVCFCMHFKPIQTQLILARGRNGQTSDFLPDGETSRRVVHCREWRIEGHYSAGMPFVVKNQNWREKHQKICQKRRQTTWKFLLPKWHSWKSLALQLAKRAQQAVRVVDEIVFFVASGGGPWFPLISGFRPSYCVGRKFSDGAKEAAILLAKFRFVQTLSKIQCEIFRRLRKCFQSRGRVARSRQISHHLISVAHFRWTEHTGLRWGWLALWCQNSTDQTTSPQWQNIYDACLRKSYLVHVVRKLFAWHARSRLLLTWQLTWRTASLNLM